MLDHIAANPPQYELRVLIPYFWLTVFVHRCFFKINPAKGSKRTPGKRVKKGKEVQVKIEAINTRVATLINKLGDFEWC